MKYAALTRRINQLSTGSDQARFNELTVAEALMIFVEAIKLTVGDYCEDEEGCARDVERIPTAAELGELKRRWDEYAAEVEGFDCYQGNEPLYLMVKTTVLNVLEKFGESMP